MSKIILAGGSGYLGSALANYFESKKSSGNIRTILWDAKNFDTWTKEIDGADVLINLTGKSVDCRYTEKNKTLIYSSRLHSTKILGVAILQSTNPPKLWINASSATIYKASYDKSMTEADGETGDDFSMNVCTQWEAEFIKYQTPETRKVILRTAIVLGKGGGAFIPLKNLVRLGLGGAQGSGKQYFSWLHEYDFCSIVEWVISNPTASGVYNVSSPNPVRNMAFMKSLREATKVKFGMPLPTWLLKFGAALIGTETELVLKSRNVIPDRLTHAGFLFKFPTLEKAFYDLLKK